MSDINVTTENIAAKFAAKGMSDAIEIYNAGHTFKYPDSRIGKIVGWALFNGRITFKQQCYLQDLLEQRRTGNPAARRKKKAEDKKTAVASRIRKTAPTTSVSFEDAAAMLRAEF
jgi:hypothetical protein